MEPMTNRPDPWAAQGIYVRMSRERKKHLLAIAKEVGHLESPVRALSAHIAASGAAIIADAENSLANIDSSDAAQQDGVHARLDRIAAVLADLSDRVADIPPTAEQQARVQLMEAWLFSVCPPMNSDGTALVLAKALWMRSERSMTHAALVHMDFEVDLLSVNGKPSLATAVDTARISSLPMARSFATDQRIKDQPIAIACRPLKVGGWDIVAYALEAGGELGTTIAGTRLHGDG